MSMTNKLLRSGLGWAMPWVRRRTHVYGVGMAKSGTHSIAGLFRPTYRSMHEPEARRFLRLLIGRADGTVADDELRSYVERKGRRLRLEVDSSSLNGAVANLLVQTHPAAHFVLTVRNPSDWLSSITRHSSNRSANDEWKRWREVRFGDAEARREDEPLVHSGLFPLDGYLRGWSRHYEGVLDAVPPDRLLVLPTEEIGSRLNELSRFVGVETSTLNPNGAHLFAATGAPSLVQDLEPDYVAERLSALCARTLQRLQSQTKPAPMMRGVGEAEGGEGIVG